MALAGPDTTPARGSAHPAGLWRLGRRILAGTRGASPAFAAAVALGLVAALATVAQALLLAGVIARVFLHHATLGQVLPGILLAAVAVAARAAATAGAGAQAGRLRRAVRADLRRRLLEKLFRLGPAFADRDGAGAEVTVMIESVDALAALVVGYLPRMVLAGAVPVIVLAAVGGAYWLAGIILLAAAPMVPFFMVLVGRAAERSSRRQWRLLLELGAHFLDLVEGLPTLMLLGRSREQGAVVERVSDAYRVRAMGTLRIALLSALVLELFAALGTAVVAVVVALAVIAGRLAFAPAFAILMLTPEFFAPQRQLGAAFHQALDGASAAEAVFRLLDAPEPRRAAGRRALAPGRPRRVDAADLAWTYPGRTAPALAGLSLTVSAGEVLAVMGPSGSGKSTLLYLLLGLMRPDRGAILVDGVPLEELDEDGWRREVALVPQRPYLFGGTVADNLRLARPDASAAQMRSALLDAQLGDFIARQPRGLDTPVGDRGERLSGGQAQRLALARALLRPATLMLLDEPTVHLDPATGARVLASLRRRARGRATVVLVTHREADAAFADRVVRLGEARAAEGARRAL